MHDKHVFLFEMVDREKNVIIYGLGKVGKAYIHQIETTHWCNIVGIYDKEIKESCYTWMSMKQIAKNRDFDYIIIAIEDIETSSQIYEELIKMGIDRAKILNMNMRDGKFPDRQIKHLKDDRLKIGIVEAGGFGDALIDMVFIKKIRELVDDKGEITFSCRNEEYFKRFTEIDKVVKYEEGKDNIGELKTKQNLVFRMDSIAVIIKFDKEKVRAISERLYLYCNDCVRLYKELFSNRANHYRFTKYALLLNRNRIEQTDIHSILGIKRSDMFSIPVFEEEYKKVDKTGLLSEKYITINRDTGYHFDTHAKMWPVDYYIELIKRIKKEYPYLQIVLVGAKANEKLLPYVDRNLAGRTSLPEMNIVLKNALLHIGIEGGIVHLMHFLGGKSMVFFGPTDVEAFGYDENINLYGDYCTERCAWLTDNWTSKCMRGDIVPRCMEGITPNDAYEAFSDYMKQILIK